MIDKTSKTVSSSIDQSFESEKKLFRIARIIFNYNCYLIFVLKIRCSLKLDNLFEFFFRNSVGCKFR